MEVCNLKRGKGKSTYLVYRSHIIHAPILCMNQNHYKSIKNIAKKMDLSIPEPITISEYFNDYKNRGEKPNKILVDEALSILAQILGTNIDTVTLTEFDNHMQK